MGNPVVCGARGSTEHGTSQKEGDRQDAELTGVRPPVHREGERVDAAFEDLGVRYAQGRQWAARFDAMSRDV